METLVREIERDYYKFFPHKGSSQLLLIFSSVNIEPRKFVFYKNTIDLPVHKLYLNDSNNGWFQSGVEGLGDSIDKTVDSILKLKEKLGVSEILTLGSSMGAYAALLYGAKLNARALCFGAEVVLGLPGSRANIYMPKGSPIYYNDIRNLIKETKIKVTLYAGEADQNDITAAKHLYGLPNVNCITIRGIAHKTPLFLEKKFGIKEVINRFILNDPIINFMERGNLCESGNAVELLKEATDTVSNKQWQEAKKQLREVLSLCPLSDVALHKLGIVLYQLKDFEGAAKCQSDAVEISPHYANAHHQLGICLRKLGKYTDSYKAHKNAYEVSPDMAGAYHHAGLSLEKLKKFNEAEHEFRKAVKLDSRNVNYTKKLVGILRENAVRRIKESEELLMNLINK
ncbi:tetratricopeptide repeat protein [Bacillus sp. V2I10]|uniref:tetratricopeptide repeat protein n=1 Tax=Bacillus sp. V2I10 TaxID=3042276 RepID=UPI00277E5ACC|nr:tetratricopeptide repeat protein [Bacillus sp. V2I10]MDQ0857206.1 tetratricopeptide (TPR) repeat protein [Bacillus sp. V2I10]